MTILTINCGSSSLKFGLFEIDADRGGERLLYGGAVERIGLGGGSFHVKGTAPEQGDFGSHQAALERVFAFLRKEGPRELGMVGHRLVYGGRDYTRPVAITPGLVQSLRGLIPFAPEHLPNEIAAIEAVGRSQPELRQYACFDTAFHWTRPEVAKQIPVPRELWQEGVMRYGFHGLSYAYVMDELAKRAGTETARGRVAIAHLGNGASMAAVHGGQPVDTTMGLTPAGGLMMGTRAGDLDPGVLLYLQEARRLSPAGVRETINRRSGLLGVSGISSDMEDLLRREAADTRAAEAIALYCYQAKKYLGGLAAVMGGLDTLIFTAGVGENAAPIRARICEGLEFLGIGLDQTRNLRHEDVISAGESRVVVRVMKTDEDVMIARHGREFL